MEPDIAMVSSDRTRGDGHKSKYKKFLFESKKTLFTVRVVKHWNKLLPGRLLSLHPWRYSKPNCSS